jgi:molybdopterin-guanine dinucleotide biosynthesis protein A
MKRTLGVVLAGGVGSRIGGAKASAELHGQPLIAYPLAAVAEAGLEPLVCAKPGQSLPFCGAPAGSDRAEEPPNEIRVLGEIRVLEEPAEPRHPLCGIVAALRAGEGRPIVALACDLPFVPAALIRALAEAPEPLVAPSLGGRLQPLCGRYEPSLLPELEAALGREESLTRTVEGLEPRRLEGKELERFGDPERIFLNVNDPDDMRRAESLF